MKKLITLTAFLLSTTSYSEEHNLSAEFTFGSASHKLTSSSDTSLGFRFLHSNSEFAKAEFGYTQFGSPSFTSNKVNAYNVGVRLQGDLHEGFTGFLRVGFNKWKLKAYDSGYGYYYGLGSQYHINENMYLSADYTISNFGSYENVNNLSLSIGFNF